MPTTDIDLLERGKNLLLIKNMAYGRPLADAQRQIFSLLAREWSLWDERPGDITVLCVWGIGPTTREVITFDWRGEQPARVLTQQEWRQMLRDWWSASGPRR